MERLYCTTEFAREIGVSPQTAFNWEHRGYIVPIKKSFSNKKYYSQAQVDAYQRGDLDNPILKGKVTNGVSEKAGEEYGS